MPIASHPDFISEDSILTTGCLSSGHRLKSTLAFTVIFSLTLPITSEQDPKIRALTEYLTLQLHFMNVTPFLEERQLVGKVSWKGKVLRPGGSNVWVLPPAILHECE